MGQEGRLHFPDHPPGTAKSKLGLQGEGKDRGQQAQSWPKAVANQCWWLSPTPWGSLPALSPFPWLPLPSIPLAYFCLPAQSRGEGRKREPTCPAPTTATATVSLQAEPSLERNYSNGGGKSQAGGFLFPACPPTFRLHSS